MSTETSQFGTVARKQAYSDFDLSFRDSPVSGDLAMKREGESIRQSVINILLTNAYERPFNPDFGGNLIDYLFENFDIVTASLIEERVRITLETHEPRISILSISVTDGSDNNTFRVSVTAEIITSRTLLTPIEFTVERQR